MSKTVLFIALILLAACGVLAGGNKRVSLSSRHIDNIPLAWELLTRAHEDAPVHFTINLKQHNLEQLETIFWDVSNPKSKNWGKYLTIEEINDLVSPPKKVYKEIFDWLSEEQVPLAVPSGDTIRVHSTVSNVEKLFNTQLFVYRHQKTGRTAVRHYGDLTMPKRIAKYVDFVAGLSELFEDGRITPKAHGTKKSARAPIADTVITPPVLRSFYNVPSSLAATSSKNANAIAAFSDFYSKGAFLEFAKKYNVNATALVKTLGPDCLSEGCDQYESDLDVQYMTAMGAGVPTWFWNQKSNYWVLEWAQAVAQTQNAPFVHSISYGWAELAQCEIASSCKSLGYNSQQYVLRTDTEFQKLGALGLSIFVSDGDDGAPNLGGALGNCPVDGTSKGYCPLGGCSYTSTQCGGITITQGSNVCIFPMGQGSDFCQTALQQQKAQDAINAFASANSACDFAFDSDNDQNTHLYSTCTCDKLKPVTKNGFTVSAYVYNATLGLALVPDYPTSSPYVTSVGATQFLGSAPKFNEVAASILTGSIITTGGGFNAYQPMPTYQQAAVGKYLSSGVNLPPKSAFISTNRAYPDISFNGHNYQIYTSDNSNDKCPCSSTEVDGTSCSSPAAAGLFGLINDALIANGKTQLGFLNQFLYQIAVAEPSAFNDVTSGNNNCNRAYCCQYGYTAASGWDPVTGLGSPNFSVLKQYILANKMN